MAGSSFEIGLSGIQAARTALDAIGNNVANAATEGYHKQRVDLKPARSQNFGNIAYGTGVEIVGINRVMDNLLESEIMTQISETESVSQALSAMKSTEINFSEFGGGQALNDAINKFFESMRDLALHPNEQTWQHQFVTSAEAMANQFRTIGISLNTLGNQAADEAESLAEYVNSLSEEIAVLNDKIWKIEISGTPSNNLRDQRDSKINELAKYVDVETVTREHGVVDVKAANIPVVIGGIANNIEITLVTATTIGLGAEGSPTPYTSGIKGQIGGLIDFKNSLLPTVTNKLDTLVKAIVDQVNQYHVQGVGSAGSFTSLTGWELGAATSSLSDLDSDISTGDILVRVTDSSGNITRTKVTIADTSATLQSVIDDLEAITGISASVVSNKVYLSADTGYSFDFIPAPLSTPTATTFTGTNDPTVAVSGHYTGSSNKTFTFTVAGTGEIGNDSSLILTVNDGTSDIASFNIGTGYVAGDKLDLGNGLKVTLSTGDLVDGNTFTVDGWASSDTAGFLAAAGINTFFEGNTAQSLIVDSRLKTNTALVATALGADFEDSLNIERMADLIDTNISALDDRTIGSYYQAMVTTLGQDISIKESRNENLEAVLQNLKTRRTEISGVDINEEAAQMLMFEQMYQAMAKYLNTVNTVINTLMDAM